MKKILQIIPVVSLLAVVFVSYADYVDDLDLWWHLKSGQFIYETGDIPDKDDFAYTTYIPDDISNIGKDEVPRSDLPNEKTKSYWTFALKSSWLAQLFLYITYRSGGFTGIGILKSLLFMLAYFILYIDMRKRGTGCLSSLLVLCLAAFIGFDFNYTRTQLFSFFLFPCILLILYDFKRDGKSIYILPLVMTVWANLHGAFILGILITAAFTASETMKFILYIKFGLQKIQSLTRNKLLTLILITSVSTLMCLINPNSYKAFLFPLLIESYSSFLEEYHRPMLYEYHAYWFMLALVIISIFVRLLKKRLDLTDLILSLIVIFLSLSGIRFIIFFVLGTGAFLAHSISTAGSSIKEWRYCRQLFNGIWISKLNTKGLLSSLPAAVSVIILINTGVSEDVLKFDLREKRYPTGAVEFIRANKIPVNIFNLYNDGGYLIWSLYPNYRVFIDGRNTNETAFFHYNQIVRATIGNNPAGPLWKRLLDAYNVNFILTNAVSSTGNIIPLVDRLYQDGGWELIYADGKSMIFLKSSQDNYAILHRYNLSKDKIYDEIISECEQGISETPATWGYYETLGFIYMARNRLSDALIMFEKYLSMNPGNQKVKYYYDLLNQYKGKS